MFKKLDKSLKNSVFHRNSDRNAQSASSKDAHQNVTSTTSSANSTGGSGNLLHAVDRRMRPAAPSPENDVSLQKRLDTMGRSLARLSRKLNRYTNNAQPTANPEPIEKRLAKMNEHALSINFREECLQLQNAGGERGAVAGACVGTNFGTCLAAVLKSCEDSYRWIAEHRLKADQKIEKVILTKLDTVAGELANCEKERKQLEKMQKELASDETKLQQAEKSFATASANSTGTSSTPVTSMGSLVYSATNGFGSTAAQVLAGQQQQQQPSGPEGKVVAMRNDVDDKRAKVEQQRDFLMANMYTLLSREKEISMLFAQLLEFTAEFHRDTLKMINDILPEIKESLSQHACSPCYGVDLEQHLAVSGREIALPIEACIYTLVTCGGLREEGLFRIAGSASKTRKLKAALDAGVIDMSEYRNDFAVLGDALKSYLRELPNPLLNFTFYNDWMAAGQVRNGGADDNSRRNAVGTVLRKLPESNRRNLLYLTGFLARLSDEAASNKMNITNLAIVVGPNLLWSPRKATLDGSGFNSAAGGSVGRAAGTGAAAAAAASSEAYLECMQDAGNIHSVVECLIRHSEYFLSPDDGDIDYTVQHSDAVYLPGETITSPSTSPTAELTPIVASTNGIQQQRPVYSNPLYSNLLEGFDRSNNAALASAVPGTQNMRGIALPADQRPTLTTSSRNSLEYLEAEPDIHSDMVSLPPAGINFSAATAEHSPAHADNNSHRNVSSFRPTSIPVAVAAKMQLAEDGKRHPPYYTPPPSNNGAEASSRTGKDVAIVDAGLPPISNNNINSNVASDNSATASPKASRRSATFRKSRPAPPPPGGAAYAPNESATASPGSAQQQQTHRIGYVAGSPQQQQSVVRHHQRNASAGNIPATAPRTLPAPIVMPVTQPKEVPRAYAEDDDIFTDTSSGHSSGYHQQLSPVFPTLSSIDQTDGGAPMARDSSMDYHDATDQAAPPLPSPPQQLSDIRRNLHRFQQHHSAANLNGGDYDQSQQQQQQPQPQPLPQKRPPRPPAPSSAHTSRTRSPIIEVQPIELSPATPIQKGGAGATSRYVYNNEAGLATVGAATGRDAAAVLSQEQQQPPTPKSLYPTDILAEAYKSYLPATTVNEPPPQQQQQQQQLPYVGSYQQVRRPLPPYVQNQHPAEYEGRQKAAPPVRSSSHESKEEKGEVSSAGDAGEVDAPLYTSSLTRVLGSKNMPQRAVSSCSSTIDPKLRKQEEKSDAITEQKRPSEMLLRSGSSNRSASVHADVLADHNSSTSKNAGAVANGGNVVIRPKIMPKPTHLSTASTTTTSATPSVSSLKSVYSNSGRAGSTSSTGSSSSCRSDVVVVPESGNMPSSAATTPMKSAGPPETLA